MAYFVRIVLRGSVALCLGLTAVQASDAVEAVLATRVSIQVLADRSSADLLSELNRVSAIPINGLFDGPTPGISVTTEDVPLRDIVDEVASKAGAVAQYSERSITLVGGAVSRSANHPLMKPLGPYEFSGHSTREAVVSLFARPEFLDVGYYMIFVGRVDAGEPALHVDAHDATALEILDKIVEANSRKYWMITMIEGKPVVSLGDR